MKRHQVRCAIGGASAALTFLLISASPAFAGGMREPERPSSDASRQHVAADREPDTAAVAPDTPPAHEHEHEKAPGRARDEGSERDSSGCASASDAGGEPVVAPPATDAPEEPVVAPPPSDNPETPVVTPPTAGTPDTGPSAPTIGLVPVNTAAPNRAATFSVLTTFNAAANAVAPNTAGAGAVPAAPPVDPGPVAAQPPLDAPIADAALPRGILDHGAATALSGALVALLVAAAAFVVLHKRLDQREPKLAASSDDDQSLDFR